MIEHKKKVVFVHIPRTGGTSIETGFGNKNPQKKHFKASDLYDPKLEDYFWFSFVRNPYDRALSSFLQPFYKKIGYKSGKSFIYFLERWRSKIPDWEKGFTQSDYIDIEGILETSHWTRIFKFEERNSILKILANRYNLPKLTKLHEKNTGSHKHRNLLGEKEKKLIQKMFQVDFERFDYDY